MNYFDVGFVIGSAEEVYRGCKYFYVTANTN